MKFSLSPKLPLAAAVLALVVAALVYVAYSQFATPQLSGVKVTLALPTQLNSATAIVAFDQDLFRKAGVEVVNQPYLLGKDALNAMLEGKADLAVVADTPFMHALLGGNDIAVLAGISQARRALAIVAHQDRHIHKVSDLKGKTLALTLGTNFPYFLDAMLQVNRVPSESVKRVNLSTDAVISAFKSGQVDAAVVFQPYLAELQAEMGENMRVFHGEDVYAFRFLLVGKPAYIDAHPEEVQRLLSALIQANRFIQSQPQSARQAVGAVVKVDDSVMTRLFDPEDYTVTLDQTLLLALDDQTRWAMQQGLIKAGPVPNYLKALKYQPLEAVQPTAVRIIR